MAATWILRIHREKETGVGCHQSLRRRPNRELNRLEYLRLHSGAKIISSLNTWVPFKYRQPGMCPNNNKKFDTGLQKWCQVARNHTWHAEVQSLITALACTIHKAVLGVTLEIPLVWSLGYPAHTANLALKYLDNGWARTHKKGIIWARKIEQMLSIVWCLAMRILKNESR